jgi:cell division protein FtsB
LPAKQVEVDAVTAGRNTAPGLALTLVGLVVIAYLAFEAVQGERGILQLLEAEEKERELHAELIRLQAERQTIENRVTRLSGPDLDLDLLDERARAVLTLGRRDELVIP